MTTELFVDDDDLQVDVERRLRELREKPDELLRMFDRNGDGVLDAEEWRAARAVVRREVGAGKQEALETKKLAGRYRIVAPIGRGSQGTTMLAVDETSGDFVAIKELDFEMVQGWDAVSLFQREAAVLGGLRHPAIPGVVDTFELDEGRRQFIVQEFVDGKSLQMCLEEGTLFKEETLARYASELLDILVYLHGHSPPVLHRDIKPANIIAQPDGSLSLVDFGAVQVDAHHSEVIGTTGYMPPEQLMGRAVPASDLYALGATLIHLATTRHPSDLQTDDMTLDWRRFARVSDRFARFLDRLVALIAEDRFTSAVLARSALETSRNGKQRPGTALQARASTALTAYEKGRPVGCDVSIRRGANTIEIELNPGRGAMFRAVGSALAIVALMIYYGAQSGSWVLTGVAGVFALAVLTWTYFTKRVRRLTGNEHGLKIEFAGDSPPEQLPVERIGGTEIVSHGKSEVALRLVTHDESRYLLMTTGTRQHAEWVAAALREFLVERRMEGDR